MPNWLKWAWLPASVMGLSACNGGEDFSDVVLPGCPIGATCEERRTGDTLVTLVGPNVHGLGYVCGDSFGYILPQAGETEDERRIPAGTAVCPRDAGSIRYFIGDARWGEQALYLGSLPLPAREAVNTNYRDADGQDWFWTQATLADLAAMPRRQPVEADEVWNRLALLASFDVGQDPLAITLSESLHRIVSDEYRTLVQGRSLALPDQVAFEQAWTPLHERVRQADAQVPEQLASGEALLPLLRLGGQVTRAGLFELDVYQTLGQVAYQGTAKAVSAETGLPALGGTVQVFPDGRLQGYAAVTLQVGAGAESATERGYAFFSEEARLDDTLTLGTHTRLQGAIHGDRPVDLLLAGQMVRDVLFDGIRVQSGRLDVTTVFPALVNQPTLPATSLGRVTGTLFGRPVTSLLPQDSAPVGMPLRMARSGLGGEPMPALALQSMQGIYVLRFLEACLAGDEGCTPIPVAELEAGNYAIQDVTHERPAQSRSGHTEVTEVHLSLRQEGQDGELPGHLIAYMAPGGVCDADAAIPVGQVSRLLEGDTALLTLLLAADEGRVPQVPFAGAAIQGRMRIQAADALYRLGDESYQRRIRATWLNPYAGWLYQDGLEPPADEELSTEHARELQRRAQGTVEWRFVGDQC